MVRKVRALPGRLRALWRFAPYFCILLLHLTFAIVRSALYDGYVWARVAEQPETAVSGPGRLRALVLARSAGGALRLRAGHRHRRDEAAAEGSARTKRQARWAGAGRVKARA